MKMALMFGRVPVVTPAMIAVSIGLRLAIVAGAFAAGTYYQKARDKYPDGLLRRGSRPAPMQSPEAFPPTKAA